MLGDHPPGVEGKADKIVLHVPDQHRQHAHNSKGSCGIQLPPAEPAAVMEDDVETGTGPKESGSIFREERQAAGQSGRQHPSSGHRPAARRFCLSFHGSESPQETQQGKQPECGLGGIGHYENPADDSRIERRDVQQGTVPANAPVPASLSTDEIHQPDVESSQHYRGHADGQFAVHRKIEGEELDHPPYHPRMVEMAPVRKKGIEAVVHLIVAELDQGRAECPHHCRDSHQDQHTAAVPVLPDTRSPGAAIERTVDHAIDTAFVHTRISV